MLAQITAHTQRVLCVCGSEKGVWVSGTKKESKREREDKEKRGREREREREKGRVRAYG